MNRAVLGVMFAAFILSLSTPVQASFGLGCTAEGNLLHNITNVVDGTEWVWEQNCEGNGCRQVPGGYSCATASFVIPMELYIMFEIIAFVFLFLTIINFRDNEREAENNIIFPLMGLVMFSALAIMSFNLIGMEFFMGAALNGSLALLSMLYIIVIGVGIWTQA